MKKKSILILAALLVIAAVAAGIILSKPKAQPVSLEQPKKTEQPEETPASEEEPEEELPAPGTVIIDKEKDITATFGVAVGDASEIEEEETAPPKKETKPTTKPTEEPTQEPTQEPTDDPIPEEPGKTRYEEFYALAPEQKDEFLNSFGDYEAFYEWLIAAQAEFREAYPDIEIGPNGSIDLEQVMK